MAMRGVPDAGEYPAFVEENDAVWAETTDGGLLKQLFGYYPTLHDARIRDISVLPETESVELVVDYLDQVETASNAGDLSVRMRLLWKRVKKLELSLTDSEVTRMDFRQRGDMIRTDFELGFGTYGFIESEGFEATLEKLDPLPEDENANRVILRYR